MLHFLIGAPNLAKHLKYVLEEHDLINDSNNRELNVNFIDSQNLREKEISKVKAKINIANKNTDHFLFILTTYFIILRNDINVFYIF